MATVCTRCHKRCYSEATVYTAAIHSSQTTGKSMRPYRCPTKPSVFHLTSSAKRKGGKHSDKS